MRGSRSAAPAGAGTHPRTPGVQLPVIRTVGAGPHVVEVRAADRWGNVSRAVLVRWRVTG